MLALPALLSMSHGSAYRPGMAPAIELAPGMAGSGSNDDLDVSCSRLVVAAVTVAVASAVRETLECGMRNEEGRMRKEECNGKTPTERRVCSKE